jgi:hypothetical protein
LQTIVLQGLQRLFQISNVFLWQGDMGKPGELPGKVYHTAFLPVTVMGFNRFGDGFDQTRAVRTKDSEDE